MRLRPPSRSLALVGTFVAITAWIVQMGILAANAYFREGPLSLSADIARYGAAAQWKGVYFHGDKIGFVVTQTVPTDDGFELQEDGKLRMTLLGTEAGARLSTRAHVDRDFQLKTFRFSLDPGTGPLSVSGEVLPGALRITVESPSGTRTETRTLEAPPALSLNLSRQLAAKRLTPGQSFDVPVFDPTTLRNAKMTIDVLRREVVLAAGRPTPALKLQSQFAGLSTSSWVTELGEVVREESPTGLLVVKETRERALAAAPPGSAHRDMLESAAIVPSPARRIDDALAIETLRLLIGGFEPATAAARGAGQTIVGDEIEIRRLVDAKGKLIDPEDEDRAAPPALVAPEPLIESDAPEIRSAAQQAIAGATTPEDKAERLLRFVYGALQKRPTVGIPSALEVLRTRAGDCNEHTALYVALCRAAKVPARIAIGVVYVHGAFYYHAWAEVLVGSGARAFWIPADPTLGQFPADATHVRLLRGGLEQQTALLPALGNLRLGILDMKLRPGSQPVLVGKPAAGGAPLDIPLPRRDGGARACWAAPPRS